MRAFTVDETNDAVVKKWDEGDCISVIELGGLGPGYEQCIHIVAVELLRRFKDDPLVIEIQGVDGELPKETRESFSAKLETAMHEIDRAHDLGLSGAQAGAALNEAWQWLRHGYAKAMNNARAQIEDDRFILVSKHWPSAEPKAT